MSRPDEEQMGYVTFNPPLLPKEEKCFRVWEILRDMDISHDVGRLYGHNTTLLGLVFPNVNDAMMFKLRL